MKNKRIDPFKNLVLDEYEQGIEDALERGEFVSDPDFKKNKKEFEEAAKRFIELEESKSITLRVKKKDFEACSKQYEQLDCGAKSYFSRKSIFY